MSDVIQSVPVNQNNLPQLWKDLSGNETYYAQLIATQTVPAAARTGISQNGSATGTGGQIVAGGVFLLQVTIQNVDPLNALFVSFNNPATANDIELLPSASYTFPFGMSNALYGLSSGSSTKFAAIGT